MRSGGDLLVASVHNTYSVDVDHAARQVGEQLGRIEPRRKVFSAIGSVFQITAVAFSTFLNRAWPRPSGAAPPRNGDSPTPLTTQFRRAIYRRCSAVILRRRWMTRRFAGTGSCEKRDQDFPDNSPTYMLPWQSTAIPCGVVNCPGRMPPGVLPSRAKTSPFSVWMLTRGPIFGQSRLLSPCGPLSPM